MNKTKAPVWLINSQGEQKCFMTQPEVDEALENGFFGKHLYKKDIPLVSELEWGTKQEMIDATHSDLRYKGLYLSGRKSRENLDEEVRVFETENEITRSYRAKE